MIDHTGIGVAGMMRSARFYDATLGALELRRTMQLPPGDGSDGVGYGIDYPVFWIDRFHPHSVRQHTAFAAKNRGQVDAFYTAALAAGGTDNGPPGLRHAAVGYPAGYYAAFVLDPNGNGLRQLFDDKGYLSGLMIDEAEPLPSCSAGSAKICRVAIDEMPADGTAR